MIAPPFSNTGVPHVILWNPATTHTGFTLPTCHVCASAIYLSRWTDGSSSSFEPRVLHGISSTVLLISAVYSCEHSHRLLAHDEIILKLIKGSSVPFVLLHRTGFTSAFADTCTAFVRQGVNFYQMETMITELRWEAWARCQDSTAATTAPSFIDSEQAKTPSNNILAMCFLAKFLSMEQVYLAEIQSVQTTNTISFDHTFKIASNIGYLREDKVWITLYDSLFLILNVNGKVVSWQLTKGTSFHQTEGILKEVRERAEKQKHRLTTVFIDDCCKLRLKVQGAIGNEVEVKLDLFHAMQRITRTLPKKHQLYGKCIKDLSLVFRNNGDTEQVRYSSTPCPSVILKNIEEFIEKWKDTEDGTVQGMISTATLKAVENLKQHISAGCISDIPPGGGTNKNERFHRHLNTFFKRSRMGVLLAYALLTVIIHSHNSSIKHAGKTFTMPILASPHRFTAHKSAISMGIIPKNIHSGSQEANCHWEIDLTENVMDMEQVVTIYSISLQKILIARILASMKLTKLRSMTPNICPLDSHSALPIHVSQPISDMEHKLNEFGLTLQHSLMDGNCFFHSVAQNINTNKSNWSALFPHSVHQNTLRQMFVNEITGERQSSYREFVDYGTEEEFLLESHKFLMDGFFTSEIGNLMPLAMATALNASIIIFTTSNTYYINSLLESDNGILFLVYNCEGPGHYDAAIPFKLVACGEDVQPLPKVTTSCKCGVNSSNTTLKSCIPLPHYSTRCGCHKSSTGCSTRCRCKNCCNTYGVRPVKATTRKRRAHEMQVVLPNAKKFASDRHEELPDTIWSDFEAIVLNEVTSSLQSTDIDIVTKVYSDIVFYSKSSFCIHKLPCNTVFRSKTQRQVAAKLKYGCSLTS